MVAVSVMVLVLSNLTLWSDTASAAPATTVVSPEVTAPNTSTSCSGQSTTSATGIALRDAVEALDDPWRTSAGAGTFAQLIVPTPSDINNVDLHPTTMAIPGSTVTVDVSKQDVSPADSLSVAPNSWGTLDAASYRDPYTPSFGTGSSSQTLQDCAPRPTSLYTASQPRMWNATSGSGSTLDSALFTFSTPLRAFGAWFGDLETRTDGNGVPARVKLFDAAGNVVANDVITPSTVDQTNDCGGPLQGSDMTGCGNQATRWIGFTSTDADVARMLVIVGDDDTCDGTLPNAVDNGDCDGLTEHLSWVGATAFFANPDLDLTKSGPSEAITSGDDTTFSLEVTNEGDVAATGVVITDDLPAGLTPVAASGTGWSCSIDGQEVTCSLTGDLAAGASAAVEVTVTVSGDGPTLTNTATASWAGPVPGVSPEASAEVSVLTTTTTSTTTTSTTTTSTTEPPATTTTTEQPATTTTASTTTTTNDTTTTTEPNPTSSSSSPSSTSPSSTAPTGPTGTTPSQLPFTGAVSDDLGAIGLLFLIAGAAATASGRRISRAKHLR